MPVLVAHCSQVPGTTTSGRHGDVAKVDLDRLFWGASAAGGLVLSAWRRSQPSVPLSRGRDAQKEDEALASKHKTLGKEAS